MIGLYCVTHAYTHALYAHKILTICIDDIHVCNKMPKEEDAQERIYTSIRADADR